MKKHLVYRLAGAILLFTTVTGCMDDLFIRGNGILDSETRFVTPFSEVNHSGNFIVHITSGTKHEVVVSAESNLLPYIETDVRNGNLNLSVAGIHSLKNTRPIEIYITTPILEAVRLSGSGEITTGMFNVDKFKTVISGSGTIATAINARSADIVISGSGNVEIFGNVNEARMTISGSGKIYAYDLQLRECIANISGSGDMFVKISRSLQAAISGSGYVYYIGTPSVQTQISGSGKVIREF